jgi:hypothetical protein
MKFVANIWGVCRSVWVRVSVLLGPTRPAKFQLKPKLKLLLRSATARTKDIPDQAITDLLSQITRDNAQYRFSHFQFRVHR